MTAELNARRAILEDLNLDHVLCVLWDINNIYIGYANGGFEAKVCTTVRTSSKNMMATYHYFKITSLRTS